ncbi:MAG: ABC transporter ATP-binding protein [Candidatus Microgenomates bacterium]|jgi:ATP-binding cassette subfamily B protein
MVKTLKTFYKFVARRKLVFIVFVMLFILSQVLGSVTPYFYKLFTDAIPSLDFLKLVIILAAYITVSMIALILEVSAMRMGDQIIVREGANARSTIFKYVQDLDFSFHSSKSTGSLISAFKRGDSAFFGLFFDIHYRILSVIVSFFVLAYFFLQFGWSFIALIILSFAIALFAMKFLIKNNVEKRNIANDEEDNVSAIITDNLMAYETVKLFAKEKAELGRLNLAFIPWKTKSLDYQRSFRSIDLVMGIIINLSMFAILLLTLHSTIVAKLTIGDFVMIAAFISSFFPRLWELVWGLRDVAKDFADIEKYFGLLNYQIDVKDPEKPIRIDHVFGEIIFDKAKFAYGNRSRNAIDGINLKIDQGLALALVGRSGSGKTTLVKLLMRFYDLQEGSIMIDGINIKDFKKNTLRGFIGMVPQEPILFNNTIAYNIGYGKVKPKLSEIRFAANMANIDDFIQSLPKKYETEVGERGVKLSGGQKQRLSIARMILSDPDIIIFDEATSQLDSESERLIQDAFWKARRGKTTIIIAHRLSTIMKADRIVVMEKGKIVEEGTHKGLLAKKDSLYSHFWNLQIKLD